MKLIQLLISATVFVGMTSLCHARCTCDDWVSQGGYCVDYVKSRIPEFPIPNSTAEIAVLKNKEIAEISVGDVAMFNFSNYWHVAYVEKVHLDDGGKATALDMSEMNYGGDMSFDEFKGKWKSKSRSEWKRAVCCGVTDNYDETSVRKNVPLTTVKQVWSPDSDDTFSEKVKDVLNHFFSFTGIRL